MFKTVYVIFNDLKGSAIAFVSIKNCIYCHNY